MMNIIQLWEKNMDKIKIIIPDINIKVKDILKIKV